MTDFSRVKQNLEARGFRVSVFATAAEQTAAEPAANELPEEKTEK